MQKPNDVNSTKRLSENQTPAKIEGTDGATVDTPAADSANGDILEAASDAVSGGGRVKSHKKRVRKGKQLRKRKL